MRNPLGIHRQAEQEANRGGSYYEVFLREVIEESKGKSKAERQTFTQELQTFVNKAGKQAEFYQGMLTAAMKQFKEQNSELFLRGSDWESIVKSSLVDHFVELELDQNARKQFFQEALSKVDLESKVGIDNQPMENLSQHLENNYQKFESVLFPSLNVGFNQLNAALARVEPPSSTSTSTTVPEKKRFFSRFGAKQEDPVKEQSQALEKGFGNVEIQFNILNGLLTTTTFEKYNATKSAIEKQKAKLKEVQDEFLGSLPTEELKAKFTQVIKSQSQVVQVSELKFDENLAPIQRQNSMNLLKPNLAQLKVDTQELKNDLTAKVLKKVFEQQAKEDKRASTVSSTSTADPQTLSLRSSSSRKSSDADLPSLASSTPLSSASSSPRDPSSSEDVATSQRRSRSNSVTSPVYEILPSTETEAEKLERIAKAVIAKEFSVETDAYQKENGAALLKKIAELQLKATKWDKAPETEEAKLVRIAKDAMHAKQFEDLDSISQRYVRDHPKEIMAKMTELSEAAKDAAVRQENIEKIRKIGGIVLGGAKELRNPDALVPDAADVGREINKQRAARENQRLLDQEPSRSSDVANPPIPPSRSSSSLQEQITWANLKSASQQADSSVAKPLVAPSIAQAALLQKGQLKKTEFTPKSTLSSPVPDKVVAKTPAQIMAEEKAKRAAASTGAEKLTPSRPLPQPRQMPVKQGSHTDAALNRSSDGIEVK